MVSSNSFSEKGYVINRVGSHIITTAAVAGKLLWIK